MTGRTKQSATLVALAVTGFAVTGCMSSPTYGTDKTSGEQLLGDVSGILSLSPKKGPQIDYKPRPELVKPAKGTTENLPAPQDTVASSENPAWPESPEQKRARIRADATNNRDRPGFETKIENDMPIAVAATSLDQDGRSDRALDSGIEPVGGLTVEQKRIEVQKRLAEQRQGSAVKRKYLSEPPLTYREPSATAPVGDIGEDELKKERRLKAAAKKGKKWSDLWPF